MSEQTHQPTKLELKKKKGKKKKMAKKAARAASNVFNLFSQAQVTEFKEVFNMIDQNRTGGIDKEELEDVYSSLGIQVTDEFLEGMMEEATGEISFTMFLKMFFDKMEGTDPEDFVNSAFATFDEEGTGKIPEHVLKEALMTMGDDR